jgi:glutaredoxin-related protein
MMPFIQRYYGIIEDQPLKGAILPERDTVFTVKGWFAGSFQQQREKFLNEDFGFRNFFVRLNNQLAFELFNKASAKSVVVGKKNYLFEVNYIRAYNGSDFIGEDSILGQVKKLRLLQDTLSKLGKDLILILAPGKGSFYPEFLPGRSGGHQEKTNYHCFRQYASELNLNLIDFNSYFFSMKNKSMYPLYPKFGIHWSYYGACIVADSIISYIEHLRGADLPGIYWNETEIDFAKNGDFDVAEGLNLLFNLKPDKLAYPKVEFESKASSNQPSALVISDSFYWILYNMGFQKVFSKDHFWYYNRGIYPEYFSKPTFVDQLDIKKEILSHDVIILMAGEANLLNLGWGFIETANKLFMKSNAGTMSYHEFLQQVNDMRNFIKSDSAWLEQVRIKALKKSISLDSMLTLDAIWSLQH